MTLSKQHTATLVGVAMVFVLSEEGSVVVTAAEAKVTAGSFRADGVRLQGLWFEEPVRRAVQGAARVLADPACSAVLDDFPGRAESDLRARLTTLAVEPSTYARMVLFYDGSHQAPCRRPRVSAFTAPGSRIVYVCPALGALVASDAGQAEAVVVHEILHTLGLPENPPTSDEITAAVVRRCGPVRAALQRQAESIPR